jgi:hypothetical protein
MIERGVELVEQDRHFRHRIAGLGGVPAIVQTDADDLLRMGHAGAERRLVHGNEVLSCAFSVRRLERAEIAALLGGLLGARQVHAVLTSATCEKACGKVADLAPARGSYSSQQADIVAQAEQPLEQRRPRRGGRAADRRRRARSCRRGTRLRRAAGRPRLAACRSAARSRRRAGRARSPRPCRDSADRPAAGSRSAGAAAGSRRAPSSRRTGRSLPSRGSKPFAQTSAWISRAARASGRPGPRARTSSALLIARSNATQAMTLE